MTFGAGHFLSEYILICTMASPEVNGGPRVLIAHDKVVGWVNAVACMEDTRLRDLWL